MTERSSAAAYAGVGWSSRTDSRARRSGDMGCIRRDDGMVAA
jgi:hypothetical protein